MKIYFAASISLSREMLPIYKRIVEVLKAQGHEVLSEHVIDPKLKPGMGSSPGKVFEEQTAKIKKADVVVAEVTAPSWGTAFLIEEALEAAKPVLVLYYQESTIPLPVMIEGHPELYVEHYDEDNLETILKRNLKHFEQVKQMTGKLVVIDGADGSGKATQAKLLLEELKHKRVKHKQIAFPRYHTSFHGKHVGRFLTGEFGGNTEVSPYLSSLAYALDRLTAREELVEWLREGNVVVADRYVSASMAHQASKLPENKQDEFVEWLYDMEYKEHKLPREDVVIYLYVPAETSQRLLEASKGKGVTKEKDMAEKDIRHQKLAIEMYKRLCNKYEHWELIECVDSQGNLLSKEAIHKKVMDKLNERGIV